VSDVSPDELLDAYAYGIFPMSEDRHDPRLFWVDPDRRGILPLHGLHIPKRLARTLKQNPFEVRINSAFGAVMEACATAAPDRPRTWINDPIIESYGVLHQRGHAHSVECWQDDVLVGGLYGVSLGAAFFGESMFSRVTGASKIALIHLVARLIHGGFELLDTQFITEHLARFGAIEISRGEYRKRLRAATARSADFLTMPQGLDGAAVLQAVTQTS